MLNKLRERCYVMSEELQARGMLNKGQVVFRYEYLVIGATNLQQLRKAGFIPNRNYGNYGTRKPDRLLIDKHSKNPSVIAVIEDKKNGRFLNRKEITRTMQQCNDVCQEVGAKIGVITDGSRYIWFNPNQPDEDNMYQDLTTNKSRSYTIIMDENGSELKKPFTIDSKEDQLDLNKLPDSTQETIRIINELVAALSPTNSTTRPIAQIDPLPLAKRVWQDIWVATGKSPEKCLYNVVELLIFKFLSDLEVLKEPANFAFLFSLYNKTSNNDVLDYYAKVCRPKIIELFPKGDDGTTVINGTIFVENDRPVFQMATLFRNSIKKFEEFGEEFGSLKNINKDFKTRLYENFLKQSEGLKTLGQYFTPRKVVRAIVQMSGVDHLVTGQKICDPFCGVGGFVLEPINLYQSLRDNFLPHSGSINPKIQFRGYDKGFEKDEERTIILAKANMLIYLADLVSKYNNMTNQFATVFNDVFKLLSQTNLGTLGVIIENEEEKYDLIMTNPPYVTSGISTLKSEIQEKTKLKDFYRINAGGVEGLALEWIIRSLKRGGKAFVIIPDGLLNRLNDKKMRQFILEECILDAIISLPAKTFFTTPKKTYIVAITKKNNQEDLQEEPVFTYLVSNIGETLDANRFDIPDKNDLEEMISLFNQFKGSKMNFISPAKRCKIQPIEIFDPNKHWSVDRWWSKEEKISLGIEEETAEVSQEEFYGLLVESHSDLEAILNKGQELLKIETQTVELTSFREINLGDETYFKLTIGKRILRKDLFDNRNNTKAQIPLFSANVFKPFGYLEKSNIKNFANPYIIWGIDGNFELAYKSAGEIFATTDHCGTIEILDRNIDPEYLLYQLNLKKFAYGFDRGLRANMENVRSIVIDIPTTENAGFDIKTQQMLLAYNMHIIKLQNQIKTLNEKLALISDYYVNPK